MGYLLIQLFQTFFKTFFYLSPLDVPTKSKNAL